MSEAEKEVDQLFAGLRKLAQDPVAMFELIKVKAEMEGLSVEDYVEATNRFARVNQQIAQELGAKSVYFTWGPEAYTMTEQQLLEHAREVTSEETLSNAKPVAVYRKGEDPWYADEHARRLFEGNGTQTDVRDWVKDF